MNDDELEARLRAHYGRSRMPAATPGWTEQVEEALSSRRSRPLAARPLAAAAAVVVLLTGFLVGLQATGLLAPSASALPSGAPPSAGTSSPAPATLAPSASPASSAAVDAALRRATVDRSGTFPGGGLWSVSGTRFLVSPDAGSTWSEGTVAPGAALGPDLAPRPLAVTVADAGHAWMVTAAAGATPGDGSAPGDVLHLVASRTIDGGRTWTSVPLPGNWPGTSVELAFPDGTHGYILVVKTRMSLAGGAVFATDDGGRSWTLASSMASWAGASLADPWLGAEFTASDATTLWAGANAEAGPVAHPVLAVSRDSGRTWAEVPLPALAAAVGGTVYGGPGVWLAGPPTFSSPSNGWVTLSAGAQLGLVYRTTDGGRSWSQAGDSVAQPAAGIAPLDATHWLLPVENLPGFGLLATADGGQSWAPMRIGAPVDRPWLVWIGALGGTHVAAAADLTSSYPSEVVLLLSADAGTTWTPAPLPAP